MKKVNILFLCVFSSAFSFAQIDLKKLKNKVQKDTSKSVLQNVQSAISQDKGGKSLSGDEIISGLKEALTKGAVNSTKILNLTDGYFGNAAVKILMPDEAKKVESTLRKMGMSSMVDKAIFSMNSAAEDAAGGVTDIFIAAIKKMTLNDGLAILKGGDFAATEYLKKTTTEELIKSMKPVIDASLSKVNATTYWEKVFSSYNKLSPTKVNTDLSAYVTTRALEGLFYTIGLEEQKIRKDPAARTTDLLKKVFSK